MNITALLLGWAGFIFTLVKWLLKRAELKRERGRRLKAEQELNDITRRGKGPFLRAVSLRVPHPGFEHELWVPGSAVLPGTVPKGAPVQVTVANEGAAVRDANDDWPSPNGFKLENRKFPNGLHRVTVLNYTYDPSKHGQTLPITLTFETADGLKLNQTYETRHGFCELRRVDPI